VATGIQMNSCYSSAINELKYQGIENPQQQVTTNIVSVMKRLYPNDARGLSDNPSLEEFYDWIEDDIRNTRTVQNVLFKSALDPAYLLMYGNDAFKKQSEADLNTLEKGLNAEEVKAIHEKTRSSLDNLTDQEGKRVLLNPTTKEYLHNQVASNLISSFQNPNFNAVNG
jgi:hypothetical protein